MDSGLTRHMVNNKRYLDVWEEVESEVGLAKRNVSMRVTAKRKVN